MAFGSDKKNDLIAAQAAAQEVEIRMLREQLAEKKEEIRELKEDLRRTQDALVAKESPEAYRDHVQIREQAQDENLTEEQRQEIALRREEARIAEEYIAAIEGPLFKSPDDMISMLSVPQGPPVSGSLHNDGES